MAPASSRRETPEKPFMEQGVPVVLAKEKLVYRLPAAPFVGPAVRLSWLVTQAETDPAVMLAVGEGELVPELVGAGEVAVAGAGVEAPTEGVGGLPARLMIAVGTATAASTAAAASRGTPHLWFMRPVGRGPS